MARFLENDPATYADAWDFLEQQCETIVALDTLRKNIREMPEFRTIDGIPMEKERVQASPEEIEAYLETLSRLIAAFGLPAGMLVNIDEAGHQCWQDAHRETVIVPVSYTEETIPMPVRRNEKRATLLGGICADGTVLDPLVIVPRVTIEKELLLLGGAKLHIAYQPNGFITQELFEEWCRDVLFPFFWAQRQSLGYDGFGVLILDGCSCHNSDQFLEDCVVHGIVPLELPAHSSDQLQPLDLVIFALQKAEASRIHPGIGLNPQTVQVLKVVNGYHKACCPSNVISAFQNGAIEPDMREVYGGEDGKQLLGSVRTVKINRAKARKVRHYEIRGKRVNVKGRILKNNGQLTVQQNGGQEVRFIDLLTAACETDSDE
jgi:hypothetical protein